MTSNTWCSALLCTSFHSALSVRLWDCFLEPGSIHCPCSTSDEVLIITLPMGALAPKSHRTTCSPRPLLDTTVTSFVPGSPVLRWRLGVQGLYWGMLLESTPLGEVKKVRLGRERVGLWGGLKKKAQDNAPGNADGPSEFSQTGTRELESYLPRLSVIVSGYLWEGRSDLDMTSTISEGWSLEGIQWRAVSHSQPEGMVALILNLDTAQHPIYRNINKIIRICLVLELGRGQWDLKEQYLKGHQEVNQNK